MRGAAQEVSSYEEAPKAMAYPMVLSAFTTSMTIHMPGTRLSKKPLKFN